MHWMGLRSATATALMGCALAVISAANGRAAEIRWDYDADSLLNRLTIYISGVIEPGDLKQIKEAYDTTELFERLNTAEPGRYQFIPADEYDAWRKRWERDNRETSTDDDTAVAQPQASAPPERPLRPLIHLNSPGGNLSEALDIGRWAREKRATIRIAHPSTCASACVFILAAGSYKHVWGGVVIHRPYFSEMPQGDVGNHLRRVLQEVRKYLSEMNIPEGLADDMFSVKPEDGLVLSADALSRYRLNEVDIGEREKNDLRQAERLGISRAELIRRRQTYNQALEFGACDDRNLDDVQAEQEYLACLDRLDVLHGLRQSR
jgi:hypothetical protein